MPAHLLFMISALAVLEQVDLDDAVDLALLSSISQSRHAKKMEIDPQANFRRCFSSTPSIEKSVYILKLEGSTYSISHL
jgi:hypothetical protein